MKFGILITVRVDSTRLPRKCLRPLQGKPFIAHLIRRMKRSKRCKTIIISTTARPVDSALARIAKKEGVHCFRGSTQDIIERNLRAARENKLDFIINIDGDDVYCDPALVDATIAKLAEGRWDVAYWKGLPFGAAPLGLRVSALAHVYAKKTARNTETGWGGFFLTNRRFRKAALVPAKALRRPEIRLSLDYPDDLKFVRAIAARAGKKSEDISIADIVSLVDCDPSLAAINAHARNIYWGEFKKKSVDSKLK